MKLVLQRLPYRLKLWILSVGILAGIAFVTRTILFIVSWSQVDKTFLTLSGIWGIGFSYDLVNAVYFTAPLVLYLLLLPERAVPKTWNRIVLNILFFITTFILLFNAAAEFFFWDEFGSRFNFIAVDYLVYTTEVIGNINQSYPITWIVGGLVILTVLINLNLQPFFKGAATDFTFRKRALYAFVYMLTFCCAYLGVNSEMRHFSNNAYVNELAGNGMYELFAAYRNNELDYERFYSGMDRREAFALVHDMINTPDSKWMNNDNTGIERKIIGDGQEKKFNVVLISVESFSAEFMDLFGSTRHITPFLDSLSAHSMVFTNLYATGTRTVRGLEALSLCVPPTPGQSIVRRPKNEHLFSLGNVFHEKGYACEYIYGGYGYFDNMNYFFGNNGYDIVDRTALDDEEIHHENVWGVADEDLFTMATREIDRTSKLRPVFTHIMTTSNHRPFTYPDGRIDIPSHTGRNGAVKYTDYAIGKFIKEASHKEWFHNTVFVIVADHCASSAGTTDLPVNKYHIPMLVYSPENIQPGVMNRLMSQIDIGPTLLGMLNFSYTSKFFGYDMFRLEPGKERAFISTYQNLGYLKDGKLVILSPRQRVSTFALSDQQEPLNVEHDKQLEKEAMAWYQSASYSFSHGLMKQDERQTNLNESTNH